MSTQNKSHDVYAGTLIIEDVKGQSKDANTSAPGDNVAPEAATNSNPAGPAQTQDSDWEGQKLTAEPIPFKCFGKTTRIKLDKLGGLLHKLLRQKFHDLVGVWIEPYPTKNGGVDFITKLYFEDNKAPLEPGEIKNLENLVVATGTGATGSMYDAVQIRANRSIGKTYTISMLTRQLLAPYMYGKFNNNHPKNKKWDTSSNNALVSEIHTGAQPYQTMFYRSAQNTERIIVEVRNFDIKELLRLLYGSSSMVTETVIDDNNEAVNYQTSTNKTYYDIRYIKRDSYGVPIVNIEQFDKGEVDSIIVSENPPIRNMNGNVYYYSAPDAEPRAY